MCAIYSWYAPQHLLTNSFHELIKIKVFSCCVFSATETLAPNSTHLQLIQGQSAPPATGYKRRLIHYLLPERC